MRLNGKWSRHCGSRGTQTHIHAERNPRGGGGKKKKSGVAAEGRSHNQKKTAKIRPTKHGYSRERGLLAPHIPLVAVAINAQFEKREGGGGGGGGKKGGGGNHWGGGGGDVCHFWEGGNQNQGRGDGGENDREYPHASLPLLPQPLLSPYTNNRSHGEKKNRLQSPARNTRSHLSPLEDCVICCWKERVKKGYAYRGDQFLIVSTPIYVGRRVRRGTEPKDEKRNSR